MPRDLLLNVNVPAGPIQGVSFTRLGRRVYKQSIVEKLDPRGRKYYWIAGTPQWQQPRAPTSRRSRRAASR